MNFVRFTSITLILLSLFCVNSLHAKNNLPVLDRLVASVNGEAITESELNRQTDMLLVRLQQSDTAIPPLPQLKKQILDKLILEKLQLQMAKADHIVVDDETVNQAIEDIAKRDEITVNQLRQYLEEQGVSFSQFKKNVHTEILISRVQQREISQNITVSKKDVDHFLNSAAGQDETGTEFHLGHILIPLPESPSQEVLSEAENRGKAIIKELKAGANFSKVAMERSSAPHALEGGDLGWRKLGAIPTLFAKLVPTMSKDEIIGPIRDASGFHIIKLLNKRSSSDGAGKQSEIRQRAMDALYQRKFEENLLPWLRRLREDADVEIYLNETK